MPENPFSEDPVIRIMLEEADVATLKTLRRLDSNWNSLNLQELGRRAVKGGMSAIKLDSRMLGSFMADTRRNPQLFRSFRLQFLELKVIGLDFYSKYCPIFVQLEIGSSSFVRTSIDDNATTSNPKLLCNFLNLIAPSLEDLEIHINFTHVLDPIEMPFHVPVMLPQLRRFAFFCTPCEDEYVDEWLTLKHFTFIFDKDGQVDPTPRLKDLKVDLGFEICTKLLGTNSHPMNQIALVRWSKLTHLKIGSYYNADNCQSFRFLEILLPMARAGISLEFLDLVIKSGYTTISSGIFRGFCKDFSHFLTTQAKSLKVLNFECDLEVELGDLEDVNAKIQLPIFEGVHSLKLDPQFSLERNRRHCSFEIFDFGPLPVHFPNLDHLEVEGFDLLSTLCPDEIVEPISLKSLHLEVAGAEVNEDWEAYLGTKFRDVEEFEAPGRLLGVDGLKLPWSGTLKILKLWHIRDLIKVSHLSNLVELKVLWIPGLDGDLDEYLGYFKQVLTLNLTTITFNFYAGEEIPPEVAAKFIEHFPFPVKFETSQD